MNKTKIKTIGLPIAALALVTGIAGAQSLSATTDTTTGATTKTGFGKMRGERKEMTDTQKAEMEAKKAAFEATLTADQKIALEKSHKLMKAGNKTEAKAVLTAAGITLPTRPEGEAGHRGGKGMMNLTDEQKAEMKAKRDAFEATLTSDQKIALEKSHEQMKSGDRAAAEATLTAAGITLPTKLIK